MQFVVVQCISVQQIRGEIKMKSVPLLQRHGAVKYSEATLCSGSVWTEVRSVWQGIAEQCVLTLIHFVLQICAIFG